MDNIFNSNESIGMKIYLFGVINELYGSDSKNKKECRENLLKEVTTPSKFLENIDHYININSNNTNNKSHESCKKMQLNIDRLKSKNDMTKNFEIEGGAWGTFYTWNDIKNMFNMFNNKIPNNNFDNFTNIYNLVRFAHIFKKI